MKKPFDVFKRKEVKYLLSDKQYSELRAALEGKMHLDDFGQTVITSIYYDTADWSLIERSLDKPLYKEKLRVRIYGTRAPRNEDDAFIEIKSKFKGIVYKRRVPCTYGQAQAFLRQVSRAGEARGWLCEELSQGDSHRLQVLHEIAALVVRWGALSPSMAVSCSRLALTSCCDQSQEGVISDGVGPETDGTTAVNSEDLRITFDSELMWRDVRVARHACARELLDSDQCIMEVKTSRACPLWLVQTLNDSHIYPSSFSKYGTAYKARRNTLERSSCA